jgi:hypothetical protein
VDKVVEVIAEKIVEVPVPYEVTKEVIVEKKVEDLDRIRKLEAQIKKFEDTIALHQLHTRYAYTDKHIQARARRKRAHIHKITIVQNSTLIGAMGLACAAGQ